MPSLRVSASTILLEPKLTFKGIVIILESLIAILTITFADDRHDSNAQKEGNYPSAERFGST